MSAQKDPCNFPSCPCHSGNCSLLRADPRYERGAKHKQEWLAELLKHFPAQSYPTSALKLCKCHFRPSDLLQTPSQLRVKTGALPDIELQAIMTRMKGLEKVTYVTMIKGEKI